MNKKKNLLFPFFIILFFCVLCVNIKASTTSCGYSDLGLTVNYDEAGTATLVQTKYETIDHQWPIAGWFYTKSHGAMEYINELNHIKKELYGSCPERIYACTYEKIIWFDLGVNAVLDDFIPEGTFLESISGEEDSSVLGFTEHKKVFLYYSEQQAQKNTQLADLPNGELVKGSEIWDNFEDEYDEGKEVCGEVCGWIGGIAFGTLSNLSDLIGIDVRGDGGGIDAYYEEYKDCNYVNYTGDGPTYNLACPNLNIYLGEFNDALNKYKDCSETDAACISKTISSVDEAEETIKNYCRSILQNYSYADDTEKECLDACIDIVNQTQKAKKSAGLISDNNGECGFSERLLVWIRNILRWIKYILPVFVIVLGILDFIKAIGADKDDEMKKAQKRFVTRLIAAALVFIIPLILEFVLDKMGFGYDSCGLF